MGNWSIDVRHTPDGFEVAWRHGGMHWLQLNGAGGPAMLEEVGRMGAILAHDDADQLIRAEVNWPAR